MTFDDKMNMVVLKKGTNNFTCISDDPTTPSNDPVCVDENGLAWSMALIKKRAGAAGGQDRLRLHARRARRATSNVDPFAPPPADGKWSEAGPHVMIFNAKETMGGYPKPGEKPDVTQPG